MVGTFIQRDGSITSAATDNPQITGATAMTQAPELKPCPFCGGAPELGYFAMTPNIHCPVCRYEIDGDAEEKPLDVSQASKLVERWNTRAVLPPTPAEAMRCPEVAELVEAMRNAIVAIDAEYDGPDDHGRYSTRERAALSALEQWARRG